MTRAGGDLEAGKTIGDCDPDLRVRGVQVGFGLKHVGTLTDQLRGQAQW